MRKRTEFIQQLTITIVVIAITALFLGFNILESLELWYGDHWYNQERTIDNRIKIIGIDDNALKEMGPFQNWTRQEAADLISAMNQGDNSPAVIAFDINYFSDMDETEDNNFAKEAQNAGNVITASYVAFSEKVQEDESGSLSVNPFYIESIENPYEALASVSSHGFSDTIQDSDNYVRRAILSVNNNDATEYNFSYEVYSKYMETLGEKKEIPKTSSHGIYGFKFSSSPGSYEEYSYSDVVNGKIDPVIFKDSIVLIGAYAPGMMDQYLVPTSQNAVMNGVEIHANHIDALLNHQTYTWCPTWVEVLIGCLIIVVYLTLIQKKKLAYKTTIMVILESFIFVLSKIAYDKGMYIRVFTILILILSIYILEIMFSYMQERLHRKKITDTFCKYMPPQVVQEFVKKSNYQISLGGETKDVAVLFVDIRGFTTLSERMQPEQIVGILDEYLGMVTNAVFHYEGTVDKFIGDAVMAVYNAPLEQENYCDKAVETAKEIQTKLVNVNKVLQDKYNVEINVGIGIHCGQAVVGNIGCDYRMDYTAIGDTVNTASRLESNAGAGEILISTNLYERLTNKEGFVQAQEIALKGKEQKVSIYKMGGSI